ncbi:MAG: response regulator [Parvibaculaceae bacterium]|nr:response regulator [Parvibaculaceae bacterium]
MIDETRNRDTVLVVDDTPDTLGFLTDALEQAGITVLVAIDGEGALTLLDQITPDLVLMDAIMPGMDGFETCRRLKRINHLAHLPVIFMTGLSETQHVLEGLQAGGVDYVTKPIVVDELIARIHVHLANARATQSARIALDATGRFLLTIDEEGRLLWCTPQATKLLSGLGEPGTMSLPPAISSALDALKRGKSVTAPTVSLVIAGRTLEFSYLSAIGPNEYLFRLTETGAGKEEIFLKQYLSLTMREAEVLIWIAKGKSNRDISEILGISPRTVNKHLEQIFTKLGVENRASAAALAVRALSARG